MGRYKALIGLRLRTRGFVAQQTEATIGMAVLNRMLAAGRPDFVRRQPIIAWQSGVWGYLDLQPSSAPTPLGPASIESVSTEVRCLLELEAPACNSRSGASWA